MRNFIAQFDTLLFVILGISLIEIHLILSCIAIVVSILYSSIKLTDYFINKKKYQNEKNID